MKCRKMVYDDFPDNEALKAQILEKVWENLSDNSKAYVNQIVQVREDMSVFVLHPLDKKMICIDERLNSLNDLEKEEILTYKIVKSFSYQFERKKGLLIYVSLTKLGQDLVQMVAKKAVESVTHD